ncbi:MAG TPA: hypothetical protein VNO17_11905, partial [Actinomycetota bacterium]|nr:hypothetical protein [Actinomycetota bacterium]
GPGQAALRLAHHVLVLPNQSVLVLAPAMGGCDGLYGSGVSIDVLCTTRFPADLSAPVAGGDPRGVLPTLMLPRLETRPTPAPYYLFVLVPLSSVLIGGWAAARGARSRPEAIAAGAAAGVAFAGALALTAHLGALRLSVSAGLGGIASGGGVLLGTEPPRVLALGLAWGVVGGGLGAALAARALPTVPPLPSGEEEARSPFGGPGGGTPQRDR